LHRPWSESWSPSTRTLTSIGCAFFLARRNSGCDKTVASLLTTHDRGKLAAVQHQIMQVVWQRGEHGATASEIWQAVCAERTVGRITVLKQIQRLKNRNWLRRVPGEGVVRYVAALERDETARMLAAEFVDSFFGGSLSELVLRVVDARGITAGDMQRLRQLLAVEARRVSGRWGLP